jgi:hypothetical protein
MKKILSVSSMCLVLIVTASNAGLIVTNPSGAGTAVIDPAGAETVDVYVNPSCWMPDFNALPNRYTLSFDQAEFLAGQVLDQVIFTTPIQNTITFSGFEVQAASEWSTSANNYLNIPSKTVNSESASIKFSTPVQNIGFNVVNFNAGGFQVRLYDANGNNLWTTGQNANGGDSNPSNGLGGSLDLFVGYKSSSANIAEVRFVPLYIDFMTIAVDDLSFTQVPEPATMILMGLGGLFLLRRRWSGK